MVLTQPDTLIFNTAANVTDNLPRGFVLVGDYAVHGALEEGEQREPDPGSRGVSLHECLVVRQRVVVQEQAARDVEGHEHVYRVVFVRCQDEEDAEHVHQPRQGVKEVEVSRCIYK